jgi:hypothetical protein
MIVLKQVIKYDNANVLEATWVNRIAHPQVGTPASEDYQPERVEEVVVRCHAYADVQMDDLEADLGDDAAQYADLIAEVRANAEQPNQELVEAQRRAAILAEISSLEGGNLLARPTREFMLLSLEREALAAGYTLEQLKSNHYGYRKVKELDEQITDLRNQL